MDADTVKGHGSAEGDIGVACAVDIRCEDVDFMSASGERPAEPMDSVDWAAVSGCGQIRRNDVK